MALGISDTLRTSMADAIVTFAGTSALLRIYDGTRPSKGGTATTLLAELTCASTLGTTSAGVLTLNSVTQDSSANATGVATWFRIVKSDGTTHVLDGSVGTSGADLNLTTTSITSGQPVQVTSGTITVGA